MIRLIKEQFPSIIVVREHRGMKKEARSAGHGGGARLQLAKEGLGRMGPSAGSVAIPASRPIQSRGQQASVGFNPN